LLEYRALSQEHTSPFAGLQNSMTQESWRKPCAVDPEFCRNTGLSCGIAGVSFTEIEGSFAGMQGFFTEIEGSFAICKHVVYPCAITYKFCRNIGLFCGNTNLFGGSTRLSCDWDS